MLCQSEVASADWVIGNRASDTGGADSRKIVEKTKMIVEVRRVITANILQRVKSPRYKLSADECEGMRAEASVMLSAAAAVRGVLDVRNGYLLWTL